MFQIKPRFPLKIILQICKILLIRECFIELESLLNIFPQLKEHFSHKFPTIAVIDTNQYEKYYRFIHTRTRPFGSNDVFIIKQTKGSGRNKSYMLTSRCHMILGSKRSQELVPQAFESLSNYVTLVENSTLIDFYGNSSYKCYELICEPDMQNEIIFEPPGYTTSDPIPFSNSFQVAVLVEKFVSAISRSMLRFENYTDNDDLSLDYERLYNLHISINNHKLSSEGVDTIISRDSSLETPKCSFEIIKDFENFRSLCQRHLKSSRTETNHDENSEVSHSNSAKKSLKWNWWRSLFSRDQLTEVALFRNVKEVTIDEVMSTEPNHSANSGSIVIDCSRSATRDTTAFEFIKNHKSFLHSKIERSEARAPEITPQERTLPDDEMRIKAGPSRITSLPYYINLRYKDFLAEKLQIVEITAFESNVTESDSMDEKGIDLYRSYVHNSKRFREETLEKLRFKINSLLDWMAMIKNTNETPSYEGKIAKCSSKIMEMILNEITKLSSREELNEEQPLRLRMFSKNTDLLNRSDQIRYREIWYKKHMR